MNFAYLCTCDLTDDDVLAARRSQIIADAVDRLDGLEWDGQARDYACYVIEDAIKAVERLGTVPASESADPDTCPGCGHLWSEGSHRSCV